MEKILNIHIEKLPEGVYLATSDDLQGLVAQGRTVTETIEIARDVARKLIEAQTGETSADLTVVSDQFDYPLIIGQHHGQVVRIQLQKNHQETEAFWLRILPPGCWEP